MEESTASEALPAGVARGREAVRLEAIACPACGASEPRPLFEGEDHLTQERFPVVRCTHCGLCFVSPRPRRDAMARYYADGYFGKRHPLFADFFMWLRLRKLPARSSGGRLLDIGCGCGDFILSCRRRGWEVAGVEQAESPIMALRASLGIEVFEPQGIAALPAESFDVVTVWHVLEHLADPAETLHHIRRILKPQGVALIEVPNFGGWQGRLGGRAWFHLDVPRHLFHFERASLERLLAQQRLSAYRWQTFSLEYDAFGLAQTVLNHICRRPNHLFQLLIRRGESQTSSVGDTLLSATVFPLVLALALPASVLAAACGMGGVLRVWARKE